MKQKKRIRISKAVAHFGRQGDGYGGKAMLARKLGISQAAIGRWAGPHMPPHHAEQLLKQRALRHLAEE